MKKFTVNIDNAGSRLDKFLAKNGCGFAGFGFSLAQKLLRQKKIKVNGVNKGADYKLEQDDEVEIFGNFQNYNQVKATQKIDENKLEQIKAAVIFKDENILAIDKPSGIAVQSGDVKDFSINAALPYLKFEKTETPRLVHRLDRDTSGILLLARNRKSADILSAAFREKTIRKTYLALVKGAPNKAEDTISIPLLEKSFGQGKNSTKKVFRDAESGKEAITTYKVLKNFGDYSLLELKPITGRMHQLRVHCKEIGHPIIGDGKYSKLAVSGGKFRNRLCLHSWKIEMGDFFGKELKIESKKPGFL